MNHVKFVCLADLADAQSVLTSELVPRETVLVGLDKLEVLFQIPKIEVRVSRVVLVKSNCML